jgi:hypothetical protein
MKMKDVQVIFLIDKGEELNKEIDLNNGTGTWNRVKSAFKAAVGLNEKQTHFDLLVGELKACFEGRAQASLPYRETCSLFVFHEDVRQVFDNLSMGEASRALGGEVADSKTKQGRQADADIARALEVAMKAIQEQPEKNSIVFFISTGTENEKNRKISLDLAKQF